MSRHALDFAAYPATVVLQPTPLCNLRCTYCYLPDLSDRHRMDPALTRALATEMAGWRCEHRIDLLWHGGEPLTAGTAHLAELFGPFEPLRSAGRVGHGVQTNATLLNDRWCDLLRGHQVQVGVSIDGPRWANVARRTLSGAETFDRAMRGIDALSAHGIAFAAIAVVSLAAIPAIIARADEYVAFFASLGARDVGFNIEEHEGNHRVDEADGNLVDAFWRALFEAWLARGGQPRVRDFDRVLDFARSSLSGTWEAPRTDLLPTISSRGDVVLLSPELSGYRSARYGDFVVGNVTREPLLAILRRGATASYVAEFREGSQRCRDECVYFDYCQAGQAANRHFEHGDFLTNETAFCRHSRQAPFDAVLGLPQQGERSQQRHTERR